MFTRKQAIALASTNWWRGLSAEEIVRVQLFEDKLCMPFEEFHGAVEAALGHPVWTHEFAHPEDLQAEFLGERPAPTFAEVLALIPKEKLILVGL